ncbi:MAG: hypothetical protein ACW98J_08495 [Candidatus Thorarchaeota archaeon]
MNEETSSPNLYVFVDGSNVVRCDWCETLESEKWIHASVREATLCSEECVKARTSMAWGGNKRGLMCILVLLVLLPFSLVWNSSFPVQFLFPFLIFVGFVEILMIYLIIDIVRTRERIPKGSRHNQGFANLVQIRGVQQYGECPSCNTSINLSTVQEDMVYHCENCDASGVVEVLGAGR